MHTKSGGSMEEKNNMKQTSIKAEESKKTQSASIPKSTRLLAGLFAILVIGIVFASLLASILGAETRAVFTLIFLGVAISSVIYGFLLMNRFLKARRDASMKADEEKKK